MKATRLRKGMIINFEGALWRVHDSEHRTPGNKRGMVQTKLKKLRDGTMKDYKFRSDDEVEKARFDTKEMQYLYADGDDFCFMDTSSFEQTQLGAEMIGELAGFMAPETTLKVDFYEGSPVGIELPTTVDLKITETTPEVKGATASAQRKPATLETGLVVQVPSFIAEGEVIRVSTEDGSYLERAK